MPLIGRGPAFDISGPIRDLAVDGFDTVGGAKTLFQIRHHTKPMKRERLLHAFIQAVGGRRILETISNRELRDGLPPDSILNPYSKRFLDNHICGVSDSRHRDPALGLKWSRLTVLYNPFREVTPFCAFCRNSPSGPKRIVRNITNSQRRPSH